MAGDYNAGCITDEFQCSITPLRFHVGGVIRGDIKSKLPFKSRMDKKLEQSYQMLIEESIASGVVRIGKNGDEQRKAPRFQVKDGAISVRVEPTFEIIDLSATGMAFLSDISFKPGSTITLFLEETTGVQAFVIGCVMMETDPDLLETRYRVQCRFDNEEHGRMVLLMMSEVNKLGI